MKLTTRCLPNGKLPYDTIDTATKMMVKLFEKMPFLAELPKLEIEDSIELRTLGDFPGVRIQGKNIELKITSNHYKQRISKLEKAFNHPAKDNLELFKIEAPFMEKYFQMIKKFEPPYAVLNLIGPFTLSQRLQNAAEEQMLVDKSYRKLFIQGLCVKALWMIEKVKEISPKTTPLIMFEEPMFNQLGDIKRFNEEVTIELVTTLFSRVFEKLHGAGAVVGVQCMDKCDWKIPINAGVDIISFDAYNNPNNLNIIPEQIVEFIARGGKINWAIVPVMNESIIKSLNVDYLYKRLISTMQGLMVAGVPEHFVFNSAMVSIQGDVDKLPIIFAEKAIILANQLAKKIPVKKHN